MVKAIVLVKSPKRLIAAKLGKLPFVYNSFPVSGQFDAVALINVQDLSEIRQITTKIQNIPGVERTETMVELQ
ncbi:MAG: Lrp/AsnC family transcriptional regulator [Candidatus Nitrosotenuis sp.]|uniref:Transcriptional regulator, AsnC family n=1 Tax=Candidatus Nitrosotenuis uzonensis TaxID=1407055 RepID=V6ASE1_9ARCH|nr:Lrp/AsnC family transcriptional regulator [Candidatus Nitrosotenuis uzonensis]MCA2004118.1 Lrp/AsnC family transcriptional regulator [Candidatus Nitrosotenuis sp.]CAE6499360.1 Transcriptional regulator, AsnC family [Candidatus Nitrosotenuis uzonensis]CDI05621.1 Transcriptional regulator, AsnC family [Candidatus Nitrosotenuis uzonensis]